MRSETRYFSKGSIIADNREDSKGLMVITHGKVLKPPSTLFVRKLMIEFLLKKDIDQLETDIF